MIIFSGDQNTIGYKNCGCLWLSGWKCQTANAPPGGWQRSMTAGVKPHLPSFSLPVWLLWARGSLPVGSTLRVSEGRNCHSFIQTKSLSEVTGCDSLIFTVWLNDMDNICPHMPNSVRLQWTLSFKAFIWRFPLIPGESCITGTNSTFFNVSNVNIEKLPIVCFLLMMQVLTLAFICTITVALRCDKDVQIEI